MTRSGKLWHVLCRMLMVEGLEATHSMIRDVKAQREECQCRYTAFYEGAGEILVTSALLKRHHPKIRNQAKVERILEELRKLTQITTVKTNDKQCHS